MRLLVPVVATLLCAAGFTSGAGQTTPSGNPVDGVGVQLRQAYATKNFPSHRNVSATIRVAQANYMMSCGIGGER